MWFFYIHKFNVLKFWIKNNVIPLYSWLFLYFFISTILAVMFMPYSFRWCWFILFPIVFVLFIHVDLFFFQFSSYWFMLIYSSSNCFRGMSKKNIYRNKLGSIGFTKLFNRFHGFNHFQIYSIFMVNKLCWDRVFFIIDTKPYKL